MKHLSTFKYYDFWLGWNIFSIVNGMFHILALHMARDLKSEWVTFKWLGKEAHKFSWIYKLPKITSRA